MATTLIDTSSWVHALRHSGNEEVRQRVSHLLSSADAVWCDAVRLELWNGARGTVEKRRLKLFEEELPSLPIDETVWNLAFSIARATRSAGLTIPAIDIVIFACARRHGVQLEHTDEHFRQLEKITSPESKEH